MVISIYKCINYLPLWSISVIISKKFFLQMYTLNNQDDIILVYFYNNY